ncbi:MAG: beta-glycosidase, partial [Bacteroidota bacterium]
MTGYTWTVSAGGTITSGAGTSAITVTWIATGAQSLTVTYTNGNGCTATNATIYNVTVNPLPGAAGNITGTATVCGGAQGVAYSVPAIANANTYVWNLPTGATIATGAGTNSITVNYGASASSGNITVYGNNLCGNGNVSAPYAVTVTPLPAAAGTINGLASVCKGTTGVVYSVPPITNAASYVWTLPAGATTVSGAGTNSITVNFGINAVSGNITVFGSNTCGNGTVSSNFA